MPYTEHYTATYDEVPTGDGAYPGVYPWIRDCLDSLAAEKANADFDRVIASVLDGILGGTEFEYVALTGRDKRKVDEAAGYRTAARLWRTLVTGGLGGELTSAKDDDASESYAGGDKLLAEWTAHATRALAGVSFLARGGSGSRFSVNGPSRASCDRRSRWG